MVVETLFYDILCVSPNDDDDTIKKAYRYVLDRNSWQGCMGVIWKFVK